MSGGFSFGTPAAGTGGTGTSGFSFGSTATSSAPTTGFSFGSPATSTAATPFGATPAPTMTGVGAPTAFGATPATPAATGSTLFSTPAAGATPATGFGTVTAPAASSAPTLTFGGAPTSTPVAGSGVTAPSTGFAFGGATANPATSTGLATLGGTGSSGIFGAHPTATPGMFGTTTTPATSSTPAFGAGFGSAAATTTSTASTGIFAANPTAGTSVATATFPSALGSGSGTSGGFGGTGTAGQPPPGGQQQQGVTLTTCALGSMTFEDLERKCNEWKKELDIQEEAFLKRATQINAWDRLVSANSEKITELNEYMKKVRQDQERLDRELDFVVSQQKELEEMLEPLEQQAKTMESASIQHHTDVERASTYQTATKVNNQLRMMAEAIKEIIEHINDSNKAASDSSAMDQISKILNAHMDALQYIQSGIGTLQEKTEDINKLMGIVRI